MAVKAGKARTTDDTEPQDDRFLTAAMVAKRYSVSKMTLWRWLKADNGFPKPVYIGRNRYWRLASLEAWEQSLPRLAAA
jgi:predicted DNA-binding transcriptional regulator AlpA